MIRFLLQPWRNLIMPSFFGIGVGPSDSEKKEFGATAGIGNFATSTGEADISSASDFWQGILKGDQTSLSRFLGPAFSNISQRAGQETKTLSEFGTRSGGTAAAQQQIGDEERRQAGQLEGGLLGASAESLGSMGQGLLTTGLSADEAAFSEAKTIQDQRAAKANDIFKSISKIAETVAIIA
jgi:hypothetical protein